MEFWRGFQMLQILEKNYYSEATVELQCAGRPLKILVNGFYK